MISGVLSTCLIWASSAASISPSRQPAYLAGARADLDGGRVDVVAVVLGALAGVARRERSAMLRKQQAAQQRRRLGEAHGVGALVGLTARLDVLLHPAPGILGDDRLVLLRVVLALIGHQVDIGVLLKI
jgi:hypothetical protein